MPRSTPSPITAPATGPRDAHSGSPSDPAISPTGTTTAPTDVPTFPSDTRIFVGRVDGTAVTVTVTPGSGGRPETGPTGGSRGAHVNSDNEITDDEDTEGKEEEVTVRLRIEPPEPGRAAFVDLEPDEILRIVDHLMTIVSTRPAAFRAAPEPAGGASRLTVVATEGTTAGGLRQALASVPAEARLQDFVTDTEVVLVFGQHRQRP
ncbi:MULTISPECIES: hypothetical protein [unclassified Parafrankia]|uniref:hypothetical protein n=1 Tax=unclassified Parafrankia TaxID=2994368 RepID=UPI000DA4BFF3|nr:MULTISPECIES: hypothetical protein [unclassified Parafrankia]TCJ37932.1 hypothetical protein E0504_16960 [Parafrankia sp. BMG5.11]SQD97128.1 conserved hypothetical protein [Parafrankia sp. Ea1.12]